MPAGKECCAALPSKAVKESSQRTAIDAASDRSAVAGPWIVEYGPVAAGNSKIYSAHTMSANDSPGLRRPNANMRVGIIHRDAI
jgi:hypothetical protein